MRINFEFTESQVRELKQLQAKTGASSMKDMFNSSMSLLEWAVNETIRGNEIGSINPESGDQRVIVMPILQKAGRQTNSKPQSTEAELVLT